MDYQSNSKHTPPGAPGEAKAARPEIKKTVTGEVTVPKKTLGEKFKDTFFDGDFFKGLIHNVYRDLLVPNAKNIVFLVGDEIWKGTVFRSGNPMRTLDPRAIVGRAIYNSPVQRPQIGMGYPTMTGAPTQLGLPQPGQAINVTPRAASRAMGRSYITGTRKEAEDTLTEMVDIIDSEYKCVSVAEVHEMLGLEANPAERAWGWFGVSDARITQIPEGYLLELPQPEQL